MRRFTLYGAARGTNTAQHTHTHTPPCVQVEQLHGGWQVQLAQRVAQQHVLELHGLGLQQARSCLHRRCLCSSLCTGAVRGGVGKVVQVVSLVQVARLLAGRHAEGEQQQAARLMEELLRHRRREGFESALRLEIRCSTRKRVYMQREMLPLRGAGQKREHASSAPGRGAEPGLPPKAVFATHRQQMEFVAGSSTAPASNSMVVCQAEVKHMTRTPRRLEPSDPWHATRGCTASASTMGRAAAAVPHPHRLQRIGLADLRRADDIDVSSERVPDVLRALLALARYYQQDLLPGCVHHLRHAVQLCGAEVAAVEAVALRRRQQARTVTLRQAACNRCDWCSVQVSEHHRGPPCPPAGRWHRQLLGNTMRQVYGTHGMPHPVASAPAPT